MIIFLSPLSRKKIVETRNFNKLLFKFYIQYNSIECAYFKIYQNFLSVLELKKRVFFFQEF